MDSIFIYKKIAGHLSNTYKIAPHDNDLINLNNCRAIALTWLYFLISEQAKNSFISLSNKDSLTELICTASGKLIHDPLYFSPSLVLHFLVEEFCGPAQEFDEQFSRVEREMSEWFAEYRERQSKIPSEYPLLPELRWSDLPNELFGLMSES